MGLLSLFRKKKNQPKKEVDTKDRYSLEHLLLPEFVLGENGANILNMMLHEKGKFFTDLYGRMNEKQWAINARIQKSNFLYQVSALKIMTIYIWSKLKCPIRKEFHFVS